MSIERDNAAREARRSNEYRLAARHVGKAQEHTLIARSAESAARAIAYARRLPGFRDAVVAADGDLVILRNAREARFAKHGWLVQIEHEIEQRALLFRTLAEGRRFLARSLYYGARTCALLAGAHDAPPEQIELFPIPQMLGVAS